jgi:sulfate adenylyltransferase subunit 1 (EFTu-like GTPase family)
VQLVLRPDHEFRGYAGQIASGGIRSGDPVTIWPSGLSTHVRRIVTWDGDLEEARAPMSVTLTLEDELDVSRGDVIATGPVSVTQRFSAHMVWMDERPLDSRRLYLLKHASRTVTAQVDTALALNEIGFVNVAASRPLMVDPYDRNRTIGSFVLIDPLTNATAGAGMVVSASGESQAGMASQAVAQRLSAAARSATTDTDAILAVQRVLEEILT